MKYGYFDDENKEYVITDPATPHAWINYLGTGDFVSIISNTAGGYSFYKDARLRRITRYRYNNVPMDVGGKYFYINDGAEFWSPTWQPVRKKLDSYECRHGLGYTKITSQKNGVESKITYFVPTDESCEIHKVVLKNVTGGLKKIKLYSFVEFALWNALDDMTNFQRNFSTSEVEVENSVIYHKTEYRERRNHYAFYSCSEKLAGFDTDREKFIGKYNGFNEPEVVVNNRSTNYINSGWSPIASHCVEVELKAGEEKVMVFVLGYVENPVDNKWTAKNVINKSKAYDIIKKYDIAGTDSAILKLKEYHDSMSHNYICRSNDPKLDRMVNIWNPYQCHTTFNLARSTSGFESGIGRGIGFRDSNQDVMGALTFIKDRSRERILDLAATQFPDGSAFHQYQPLTKKGNADLGGGFNDDPLWIVFSTISYIKETGDYTILDEKRKFNDTGAPETILEHLNRSVDFVINNKGPHKLPLIGRADWNDCLNLNCFSETPDESFQTCTNKDGKNAESVFIAGMFLAIVPEYIRLLEILGKNDRVSILKKEVDLMNRAVLENGYDGEWFLRAYDDAGNKVGSSVNGEGKIFIEPQGMCIMGGVGLDDGKAVKALDSTRKYLGTKHGIKLVNPAFTQYMKEYGEITSYPPGYKENAGIFCHNNSWVIIAETICRRGNEAFDYYKKITPSYREDISEIHRMEPYVYSQMIAGDDAPNHGEAKNSWLTGTASWTYISVSQYILGVRPDFDGLIVDPCIPDELDNISIQRMYRGRKYNILIEHGADKGLRAANAKVVGSKVIFENGTDDVNVRCVV